RRRWEWRRSASTAAPIRRSTDCTARRRRKTSAGRGGLPKPPKCSSSAHEEALHRAPAPCAAAHPAAALVARAARARLPRRRPGTPGSLWPRRAAEAPLGPRRVRRRSACGGSAGARARAGVAGPPRARHLHDGGRARDGEAGVWGNGPRRLPAVRLPGASAALSRALPAAPRRADGNRGLAEPARRLRAERRAALGRPILLLASTREGEEKLLLDALPAWDGKLLVVVVPRHPQRFEEVAQRVQSRRTRTEMPGHGDKFHLGDTMGEMPFYFGACDVAVIGGSFMPLGGQ